MLYLCLQIKAIFLKELSLLEFIPKFYKMGDEVIVGPGDDCAVIDLGLDQKYFLMAVDQLNPNIHYLENLTSPEQIADKLLKRNISDIAAMGGKPTLALTAASFKKDKNDSWCLRFLKALQKTAQEYNISICGGDISSAELQDSFSLTINGWVNKDSLCLRSNAKNEDVIFVTGLFGNSFDSQHHINFTPRLQEANFISENFPGAMIDVSDGLLLDATRIAIMSSIDIILTTDNIPLRNGANLNNALTDGEDYELLFTINPEDVDEFEKTWPFKTKLTKIGECISNDSPGKILNHHGVILNNFNSQNNSAGFEHN
jgi:thiamine-monophosphate kinase